MVWGCSDCRRGKTARKLLLFSSRPRRSWRLFLILYTTRPTWRQNDRFGYVLGASPPALYTDRTPPTTHPNQAFSLPSPLPRSQPFPLSTVPKSYPPRLAPEVTSQPEVNPRLGSEPPKEAETPGIHFRL